MRATKFILDTIQDISSWLSVSTNSTLLLRTNYLVDSSSSPLTLTVPPANKLGDQIILKDQANTFDTNNITITSSDKIKGSDGDYIINVKGSTIILIYIDSNYGWQVIEHKADLLENVEIDESNLSNGYILKYNKILNRFEYQARDSSSAAPVISGPSSAVELTSPVFNIVNYDSSNTYSVSVPVGTVSRIGDQITWNLPDVSQDYTYQLMVTSTEPGKVSNTTPKNLLVENFVILSDDSIIYNNGDSNDYPIGQDDSFVFTDTEIQGTTENDWYKAQLETKIVQPESFTIDPISTTTSLVLNHPSGNMLSSGNKIIAIIGTTPIIITAFNVVKGGSGPYVYTCTSMVPSLDSVPTLVFVNDNKMYLTSGSGSSDIIAKVLENVTQDVTYDVIGTYPESGAISNGDKIIVDNDEYIATTVVEEEVVIQNKEFETTLYNGTGATQSINVGFQPGLVWMKSRTSIDSSFIFDSVRGVQKAISSNNTNIEATLSNSLIAFNSNGFEVGNSADINSSISIINKSGFNNSHTVHISTVKLDDTHVCVSYADYGNSGKGTVKVGTISGNSISWGSGYLLPNSGTTAFISTVRLDDTHICISYRDDAGSSYGTSIIGTISGTTITWGSKYVFNSSGNTNFISAALLDSTHICISYRDNGNSEYGTSIIGTISGTTITFGSEYVFNSSVTYNISTVRLDDTHFCVSYTDIGNSYYGTSRVGTVSGTTITWGSKYVFNSGDTNWVLTASLDDTHICVAYQDAGNLSYGTARIGTISGTTITWGNEYVFNTASIYDVSIIRIDSTHICISYQDGGNSSYGTSIVGTISGTTITWGNEYVFSMTSTTFISTVMLDGIAVIVYNKNNSSSETSIIKFENNYSTWCWKADQVGYDTNGFGLAQVEKYSLESGLSIIKYTGNGSTGRTLKHSLGVAPKLIIIKNLTSVNSWIVYNESLGATRYTALESNSIPVTSSTMWNNTNPSSTTITLGSGGAVNTNGQSYIAYVFSEVENISKFGSLTTTGSDMNIECGFHSTFVMLKRTDASGEWIMVDTKRGIVSNDNILNANSSNIETSLDVIEPYATGFTLKGTFAASGQTYIYITFNEDKDVVRYLINSTPSVSNVPASCIGIGDYTSVELESVSGYYVSDIDIDDYPLNIPTSGAFDWEFFSIGTDYYLAVANYYNGTSININSKIYKWNGTTFVEFQSILTSGAQDWKYFTIGTDHYIVVANSSNGSSVNVDSKIYKWNGSTFIEFQSILTSGASDWEYFQIGTDHYIAVANYYNGTYNINSKIYKWNGSTFVEFQSIATNGARSWEYFQIGTDHYLAVANYYNGTSININSKIYKWNGTTFVEFQSMATNGAFDWGYFTIGTDHYIAVANYFDGVSYNINSKIYKWNGTSFVEFQSMATNGARSWEYFQIGTDHYIAVANQRDGNTGYNTNSKIYKWNGTSFVEFQSMATNGAYDWEYFTIGTDHYLAVANAYNGTTYNIDSVIYRLIYNREFKQVSGEFMLPVDTRQLGAAILIENGESVKDTIIRVWVEE